MRVEEFVFIDLIFLLRNTTSTLDWNRRQAGKALDVGACGKLDSHDESFGNWGGWIYWFACKRPARTPGALRDGAG